MRGSCWKTLGIDPVEDKSAIRKAYARKLKEIDPEADPKAFIALRDALDEALDWLRWKQFEAEDAHYAQAEGHDDDEPAVQVPVDVPPPPPVNPWQAAAAGPMPVRVDERALDELDALLFDGDPEVFPDAALLQAVTRRILADPAMAQVDQAERVGQWLAATIAGSSPRSDPVVGMVAQHFGWAGEAKRWDGNPNVDFVVARHVGLSLLDQLADPRHDWHEAYLELTRTEPELGWNWGLSKRAVKTLLEYVRTHAPEAEGGLDPYRVGLWEDKLYGSTEAGYSGFAFSGWTIAIIVILAAARIIISASGSNSSRPPPIIERPPVYTPQRIEIDVGNGQSRVFEKEELDAIRNMTIERMRPVEEGIRAGERDFYGDRPPPPAPPPPPR